MPSTLSPSLPSITPAPVRRRRRSYQSTEIAGLLANCDHLTGNVAGVPRSHYWRAILLLGWATGLRTGSLLKIKFRDIDRKAKLLHVRGEHRPPVKLTPESMAAIDAIEQPPRDELFPWPGDHEEFRAECNRVLDEVAAVDSHTAEAA